MFNDAGCGGNDTTSVWDTGCDCRKTITQASKSAPSATGQQYSLFPNPNSGTFTIQQYLADEKPVNVEIWNSIGVRVYNGDRAFTSGVQIFDKLNFVPGMYLVRLRDEQGETYTIRFTIK